MAESMSLQLAPVGVVRKVSESESAIEIRPEYRDGTHGIEPGDSLDVLFWMHKLHPDERRTLMAHPRGDRSRPIRGVFALRSPMRPNPIGVTNVRVVRVEQDRLVVEGLDAKDGSPVIDIKAGVSRNASPS